MSDVPQLDNIDIVIKKMMLDTASLSCILVRFFLILLLIC
jgi:hypothetical protein